jgi:hypothetical protein
MLAVIVLKWVLIQCAVLQSAQSDRDLNMLAGTMAVADEPRAAALSEEAKRIMVETDAMEKQLSVVTKCTAEQAALESQAKATASAMDKQAEVADRLATAKRSQAASTNEATSALAKQEVAIKRIKLLTGAETDKDKVHAVS